MKLRESLVVAASAALAQTVAAQTPAIANPSFEVDTFTTAPGYINDNAPITGWSASNEDRAGLNPSPGDPFANNGVKPDGSNVAFIQATDTTGIVTLSSDAGITGLVIGNTYNLSYRVNSRQIAVNLDPEMALFLGGSEVIRNDVNSVGGANEYKTVGHTFTATAETMSLEIDVNVSGGGVDETLLVDDFLITETDPSFTVSEWNDDASSGIDDSLVYTHAFNLGLDTGMEADTVVNGVNFTGVAGGSPAVGGSFALSLANRGGDGNNLTPGADGSAELASDFVFGGGFGSLTLEGLVPGSTYRTSIFSVGFDAAGLGRNSTFTGTSANGEQLTVSPNTHGNNNGVRLDYEFVATGSTEIISITALLGGATFHTYAFANALLDMPDGIVVNDIVTEAGTNSGRKVTLDFSAAGDVDVYASDDLGNWSLVASDVASSPFIEDDIPDNRRFYVLVAAGETYPPAPAS